MKILALAGMNLRRMGRQRITVIQYLLLPTMLILILGIAFGGSAKPSVGVYSPGSGELTTVLLAHLEHADGMTTRSYSSAAAVTSAVEHGQLTAAVLVPADFDAVIAAGGTAKISYLVYPGLHGQQVGSIVDATVNAASGRFTAARFAATERGISLAEATTLTGTVAAQLPQVRVERTIVGAASGASLEGRFDTSAYTQLLLITFMVALSGASSLVETRELGISRRELSTPTGAWTIIAGEAFGRFLIAMFEGLFVMAISAVLFDVRWGDPLAAGLLLSAFCLVSTAAGMLLGTISRNKQFANALGVLLGLGLAALGGAMVPLELFSPNMQHLAHAVTPHAWAIDGFSHLIRDGVGPTGIAKQLGVLTASGIALLAIAAAMIRRSVRDRTR